MKHFRLNANVKFQFYFGFPINTKLLSLNMTILVDIKKFLIMIKTSLEGIFLQVFRMRIYLYIYICIHLNKVLQKFSTALPSSSVAKHKLLRDTKKPLCLNV